MGNEIFRITGIDRNGAGGNDPNAVDGDDVITVVTGPQNNQKTERLTVTQFLDSSRFVGGYAERLQVLARSMRRNWGSSLPIASRLKDWVAYQVNTKKEFAEGEIVRREFDAQACIKKGDVGGTKTALDAIKRIAKEAGLNPDKVLETLFDKVIEKHLSGVSIKDLSKHSLPTHVASLERHGRELGFPAEMINAQLGRLLAQYAIANKEFPASATPQIPNI